MCRKAYRITIHGVLALLIGAIALFGVFGGGVSRAEMNISPAGADPVDHEYIEVEGTGSGNLPQGFIYSDSMLLGDSAEFSTDLLKASVVLADAGYSTRAANMLSGQMGFHNVAFLNNQPRSIDDSDKVAYTVGYKDVEGTNVRIWACFIRGTTTNCEWFSDFNLGKNNGGNHLGFYTAADEVESQFTSRVAHTAGNADKRNVYWFTGHSRGAAVANILAGRFSIRYGYENVFAYTFACPSVSRNIHDYSMPNIYNINNTGDLIPILPFEDEEWGSTRYGNTLGYTRYGHTLWYNFSANDYFIARKGGYAGVGDTLNYEAVLRNIIPSEDEYSTPVRFFAMNLLGYYLGGKNEVTWDEFAYYYGKDVVAELVKDKILNSIGPVALYNELVELGEEIEETQVLINETIELTKDMNDAEFIEYVNNNAPRIARITKVTKNTISHFADLNAAAEIIIDLAGPTWSAGQIIGAVMELTDHTDNILDAIWHAHEPASYALYINAQFYGYKGLTGTNVTSMGANVFTHDITSIGAHCFDGCRSLTSASVTNALYIGSYAFNKCSSLASPLALREGVTGISSHAFSECGALPEISIPDTVTRIGEAAFNFCTSMVGGIEGIGNVIDIGDHAFYSCEALEGTLPLNPGILNIGDYAFTGCGALEGALELPPDIQSVGRYAFSGCAGLSSLVIPATAVKSLHEAAFASCSGLKFVELPFTTEFQPPEYSYLEYMDLFLGCNSVEQIVYTAGDPGIAVPEDLGEYVSYMLPQRSRSALKSVVLDAGISNLYASMFAGCSNLESLTLSTSAEGVTFELPPNLTSIPADLLAGCYTLPGEFSLPEHVISIGDRAFQSCGLTGDLILPEEVTSIGEEAFSDCSGLTGYLTFPDSITEVGSSAFYGTGLTKICIPGVIPEIAPDLFSHCKSLEEVIIETGVLIIGDGAFERCESLKVLEIPDSTITLGAHAFTGCKALQSVKLPISATMITYNELVWDNNVTFAQCDSIEDLVYTAGDGTVFLPDEQDVEYTLIELSRHSLRRIVLPETATSLPANLFHDCTALELVVTPDTPDGVSVRLPQGLTEIPEKLFFNCWSLSGEIVLPEGLTNIGDNAFCACGSLSGELALPEGLTGIGEKAFYRCGGLTGLTIPDSVITLGDGAFNGCDALTRVKMPISAESSVYDGGGFCIFTAYGVEEIEYTSGADTYTPDPDPAGSGGGVSGPIGYLPGYYYTLPCQSMESLKRVIFSDDIQTELYPHMFQGCAAIESIRTSASDESVTFDLPKALTYIPESAFSGCSGLTGSLRLPDGLMAIGRLAFSYCDGFTGEVVLSDQIIFLGAGAFYECGQLECVAVYNQQCTIEDYSETIPITISIRGWDNSTAQDFANTYGNAFFLLEADNSVILSATRARLCVGDVVSPLVLVNGTESVDYSLTSDNTDAVVVDGQRMTMVGPGIATVTVAIPGQADTTAAITIEVAPSADTLNLPAMLTLIGDGAFSHIGAERIYVPACVELVSEGAFDQCTKLETVVFAGADTYLAEGAFSNSQCVFLCIPGSAVELYALESHMPYLLIPET